MIFGKEERPKLQSQNPDVPNAEISRMLGIKVVELHGVHQFHEFSMGRRLEAAL